MGKTNPYIGQIRTFFAGGAVSLALFAGPAMAEEMGLHEIVPLNVAVSASGYAPMALGSQERGAGGRIEPGLDAAKMVSKGFDMIRSGRQDRAVALFDEVIADAENSLAGDSRRRLCRSQDAVPVSGEVFLDAAVCDAHFGKGFALIDMGRGDLAEENLRRASEMEPGNAHFANEYAELFKSRRDWQTSLALFEDAWNKVDKDESGPDAELAARALRGMAFARTEMGDYEVARSLLEQSLRYEPDSTAAQQQLSYVGRKQAIGS